jgi:hypothetical protein
MRPTTISNYHTKLGAIHLGAKPAAMIAWFSCLITIASGAKLCELGAIVTDFQILNSYHQGHICENFSKRPKTKMMAVPYGFATKVYFKHSSLVY